MLRLPSAVIGMAQSIHKLTMLGRKAHIGRLAANQVANDAVLWLVTLRTCAASAKVNNNKPAPIAAGIQGLRRGAVAVTWRVLTMELPN